jgi:hypothetical protein
MRLRINLLAFPGFELLDAAGDAKSHRNGGFF